MTDIWLQEMKGPVRDVSNEDYKTPAKMAYERKRNIFMTPQMRLLCPELAAIFSTAPHNILVLTQGMKNLNLPKM